MFLPKVALTAGAAQIDDVLDTKKAGIWYLRSLFGKLCYQRNVHNIEMSISSVSSLTLLSKKKKTAMSEQYKYLTGAMKELRKFLHLESLDLSLVLTY